MHKLSFFVYPSKKANLTEKKPVKGTIWIEAGEGTQVFICCLVVALAVVLILYTMKPWTVFLTFCLHYLLLLPKAILNHSKIASVWSWKQLRVSLKSLALGQITTFARYLKRALSHHIYEFFYIKIISFFLYIKSLGLFWKLHIVKLKQNHNYLYRTRILCQLSINYLSAPNLPFIACCVKIDWDKKYYFVS